MKDANFAFFGASLDRRANEREDAALFQQRLSDPRARFALMVRDQPILGARALWPREVAGAALTTVFLGVEADGAPVFALDLAQAPEGAEFQPTDMRAAVLQGLVDPATAAILGAAKALVGWHASHRFCARCGGATSPSAAGWRRECQACKAPHFPRTDPVVIMLAVHGDHCLLGRQPRFPERMYSALAGFLEPGETVEEAVRREIQEEAGVVCEGVRYIASQPWPFPSSLMIGCLVQAVSREIVVDHEELEDARWFSRDETALMVERRHPQGLYAANPMAIAHHLVGVWLEGG